MLKRTDTNHVGKEIDDYIKAFTHESLEHLIKAYLGFGHDLRWLPKSLQFPILHPVQKYAMANLIYQRCIQHAQYSQEAGEWLPKLSLGWEVPTFVAIWNESADTWEKFNRFFCFKIRMSVWIVRFKNAIW